MKSAKLPRSFIPNFLCLLLGFLLAFTSLPVLSSQAATITESPLAESQKNTATLNLAQALPLTKPESFVAAAVAKTGPAVVRIDTERIVTQSFDPFFNDPFFRDFFGEQMRPRVPQERKITGQGSGFIIDSSGIILTNAHVVDRTDQVTVTLKDGRTFVGEVRGTDEVTDLAVVRINTQGQNLPIATLGDSSTVKVGDWAIAVGNPVGLDNTVTLGIISTLDRSAAKVGIPDKRVDFLQTDAAINPGNSGGPLLNAWGEVIGINTAIRADAMGIGFAIPINKAKSLSNTLASGQKVPHPYIGIQMVNLTPEMARENNRDPNAAFMVPEVAGVLVVRVLPNTPSEKAGIRRGDVILKVNNQPVADGSQLQSIVEDSGIDRNLKLEIQRNGRTLELTVKTAQLESFAYQN